jgi:hypothetical protein
VRKHDVLKEMGKPGFSLLCLIPRAREHKHIHAQHIFELWHFDQNDIEPVVERHLTNGMGEGLFRFIPGPGQQ